MGSTSSHSLETLSCVIFTVNESFSLEIVVNTSLFRKEEIAQSLFTHTKAKGAGCVIEAQHMCMILRDPQHHKSQITTSAYLGVFNEQVELQKMLWGY